MFNVDITLSYVFGLSSNKICRNAPASLQVSHKKGNKKLKKNLGKREKKSK